MREGPEDRVGPHNVANKVVRVDRRIVPVVLEVDRGTDVPPTVQCGVDIELVSLILGAMEIGEVSTGPGVRDPEVTAVGLDEAAWLVVEGEAMINRDDADAHA